MTKYEPFKLYRDVEIDFNHIDFEKPALVCTRGLPASGKSTFARHVLTTTAYDFQRLRDGFVERINRDDIRRSLGFKHDPKREDEVSQIQDSRVAKSLALGAVVICDDTYLNEKHLEARRQMAQALNVPFYVFDQFMQVPIEECLKRDIQRGTEAVGKDVIESLYYRWWSNQEKPENTGRESAVLVDLDGTLANFKGNPYDRDFMKDVVNIPVLYTLLALKAAGHKIIIMSGRNGAHLEQTKEWLRLNVVPYDKIIMRQANDNRPDTIVKKEMYMDGVQGQYMVLMVLDDRPSVVRMWRAELGLTVFQVAPNIEF